MTADRSALVEKVAKSLWSLQYLTPYETDANSSAKIEFRAIAEGLIDLIRAEVLEEAASSAFLRPLVEEQAKGEWDDKTIDEDVAMFAAAIRALKGTT
jgi:hypothetical protein